MKTTVTLLIPLILLNPAKTKNIQKPAPLKPINTLENMENRNLFEFSTPPLKILVKYTDFEYVPQVLTYQNDTAVHFKKGVYKLSKPIFDIRLDDY